jgi:hypothetical protein
LAGVSSTTRMLAGSVTASFDGSEFNGNSPR